MARMTAGNLALWTSLIVLQGVGCSDDPMSTESDTSEGQLSSTSETANDTGPGTAVAGSTAGTGDSTAGSSGPFPSTGSTGSTDSKGGDCRDGLTELELSLVDMPADSWLTVDAGYAEQCDNDSELEWHAIVGCRAVIDAWSGGVWDPSSRQMLLWGGGHADYAGNEVYAFSTSTFEWSRLTDPSLGPYDVDPLADGQPASRHTYDGLTWMSDAHSMFAWGGSRALDGFTTGTTWSFDSSSASWTNLAPDPPLGGIYNASTVYDPATNKVMIKLTQSIVEYDPVANTHTEVLGLGFPPLWPRYYGGIPRGALDTNRGLLWWLGSGLFLVYDIANNTVITDDWLTTGGGDFSNAADLEGYPEQWIETGGGDVITAAAPGLDYDQNADQLVGWVGGAPYVLDLTRKVWSTGSAEGAPAMPTATGTYGRFRYIAAYNVFILVTATDAVHFYKNSTGC